MKLSAPVYQLKRRAKALTREEGIPLHEALNRVARTEGFSAWSLLVDRQSADAPAKTVFTELSAGDLVLVGARPGHGKTLLCLELAVEAMKAGSHAAMFTFEYNETDIARAFRSLGEDPSRYATQFEFDNSDDISADHIVQRLGSAAKGSLVVIDYLQLLDQKRQNPELMAQVLTLKAFAQSRGVVILCIAQIDRNFETSTRSLPELSDVRLPNPLDLSLFTKTCFLHEGEIEFAAAG